MSDLRVLKSLLVSCAACFTPEGSASKKKKRNFQILGKLENLSCLSVLNAPTLSWRAEKADIPSE